MSLAAKQTAANEEQIVPAHCLRHHLLRAYIDDYAQLVGACAPIQSGNVQTPESDDADAVQLIVRKNCAAALYARRAKPLCEAKSSP